MILSDISIRRPVFAWMLMVALIIFGAIGLSRLGVSEQPDVDFPVLTVNATWNGAASTWGAFQLVGTNKVTVGSVDGAFCRDANSVEVIVTGRDGNVYVSSLDSASGTYSDLAAIAAFNLT